MDIKSKIADFFASQSIEYYAVVPYADAREISPHIIKRHKLTPRSIIIFLLPYYGGETVNISRYAAARDYHLAIKDMTGKLCELLSKLCPESLSLGFGDHSPIDERGAALISSLGILGDNGLLINEKYGSYVFIADVITDIPPETLGITERSEIKKCTSCGKCKAACPTGILRTGEGECLSAITQRKGELTEAECALMRENNTAWGCDICQSVCPHNTDPETTPLEFFKTDRITELTSSALFGLDEEEFSCRAFAWRGRAVVERNLKILGK